MWQPGLNCRRRLLLLYIASAHLGSVSIIENALDEFKILSCLQTNTRKSEGTMAQILSFLKFVGGQLPLRYLGLHLISRKLSSSDCTPLNSWCDRTLSFAGGYNSYDLCSMVFKFTGLLSSFFQLK